jgi:hypothetical protein
LEGLHVSFEVVPKENIEANWDALFWSNIWMNIDLKEGIIDGHRAEQRLHDGMERVGDEILICHLQ